MEEDAMLFLEVIVKRGKQQPDRVVRIVRTTDLWPTSIKYNSAELLLQDAERDLADWQVRYRELAEVCPEIGLARTKLRQRIAQERTARKAK